MSKMAELDILLNQLIFQARELAFAELMAGPEEEAEELVKLQRCRAAVNEFLTKIPPSLDTEN